MDITMTEGEFYSEGQMEAVLDQAPVSIYVTAVNTWKLLYSNRMAKNLLLHKNADFAATCYEAAGFSAPCPFCRVNGMTDSEFLVREFSHGGRIYQLSGKLMDWSGIPAHIEYIVDITEKKQKESQDQSLREELQKTFSSIPCGLCVYRSDGERIAPVFHNPAFYRITGYSQEHIQSVEQETSFLGVHPEDVPCLQAKVQWSIRESGVFQHTYRLWNDCEQAYRWIRLDGAAKSQEDGSKLLYAVYSDVSEQARLEKELTGAKEKMQDIINAIPGGVAIYRVSDIFETIYFSDGVPELTGYTVEEYKELVKQDAAEMTYEEDTAMVVSRARKVIENHGVDTFEFRKLHRNGQIVWVRIQVRWIGEENGCPLLHCVFHNITDLKEAQLEMDHLVNSIPGGIASYRVEGERFIPTFCSDGVMRLSGHTRQEFLELVGNDAIGTVYEPDRERVLEAAMAALRSGESLDISYRMRHKEGNLIWVHLNGRRMGPLSESTRFYAVFTGMSAEARLFQNIANETADGIYVIDRESYELLYANESHQLFAKRQDCLGKKCYAALHGKDAPCEFCTLKAHLPDGEEHPMSIGGTDRFYATRFRETDWNGIPAYVKYIRDITAEMRTRREKERLEIYFQTVVKYLPGGVSVIHYDREGNMVPEFFSQGFAELSGMTVEDTWNLYRQDAMAGIHPEDRRRVREQMNRYIAGRESHCELSYRIIRGDGSYCWVKNILSSLQDEGGEGWFYAVCSDISREREEHDQIRRRYNELILQHYLTPGPDALVVGHCDITQNRILEIIDHTDSDLLETFSSVREDFFLGLGSLVVEERDREAFYAKYLNAPALSAYERNDTEQVLRCFVKLPKEKRGRYVQFHVALVEAPDTGDVTGILTVTDITEQTISDKILHQLSVTNYDFVIDLNLEEDSYAILTCNKNASCIPAPEGCHSQHIQEMMEVIVPKDRVRYERALQQAEIRRRLSEEGSYTFAFSMLDERGDSHTKNMTVSAIDLRLGRVCLVRTDITESVREQQGLLNVIAYTFELAGFIDLRSGQLTMHTRSTVLENLSPYLMNDYEEAMGRFCALHGLEREELLKEFSIQTVTKKLEERPAGYDFVIPYRVEGGLRYKQVNVLWGDQDHRTVCMVRADVTDMLTAERRSKEKLEEALALAEEANRAKSDFLSAMSHDIRTPMNAIIGMTALAEAHLEEKERMRDCLKKISVSSKHLLSLINDILDMSKIERSKISLNRMALCLRDVLEQVCAIIEPQAKEAGISFLARREGLNPAYFYGDSLRINQILLNLLSNAVKFTPEGGKVEFLTEAFLQGEDKIRCRFTVSDTGIGMPEEFLGHLFEPFARNKTTNQVEGTGLGLSITKGLVDLMGGTLSVESRVGQGSVFRIELDFDAARAEEAVSSAAPNGLSSVEDIFAGRRFLVAEDNAINAEILQELLERFGAHAVVRTNGLLAVREFERADPGTYDAILMDIQMPEMNGYEATRCIRRLEPGKTIPIIAMTANAFAEDVQASLDAGMNAHVSKPVDVEVLRATLSKALGI